MPNPITLNENWFNWISVMKLPRVWTIKPIINEVADITTRHTSTSSGDRLEMGMHYPPISFHQKRDNMKKPQALMRLKSLLTEQLLRTNQSNFDSVDVELLNKSSFIFIILNLKTYVDYSKICDVSKVVRKVMKSFNTDIVGADSWGAALCINGRVCHIVHPKNFD